MCKAIQILKWIPPIDLKAPDVSPFYTDHGVEHSERILNILDRMTESIKLEIFEIFPLLCAVWLHDIGMFVGHVEGESYEKTRNMHHLRSIEYIKTETEAERLPLDKWQLSNVLDICRAHRSKVKFEEEPIIPKKRPYNEGFIRLQLLASLLRFADACDIDNSRAPEAIFEIYQKFISMTSKQHWQKCFNVGQIRFNWDKACVEILINIVKDDIEQRNQQLVIAQRIKDEISSELKTVERIFEENEIKLFHVEIYDYIRDEYIELNHRERRETLGWTITPFAKESLEKKLDILLFKPILSQDEVSKCYVETSIVKIIKNEMLGNEFKNDYLFYSHPRTGKTSMLAFLSTLALQNGFNVFWFNKRIHVPLIHEFIQELSTKTSNDESTIIVFDNIHEDINIISLIKDLKKDRPKVKCWCATRISEFVNIKYKWSEIENSFIQIEAPGYLDNDSVKKFLDKYKSLLDKSTFDLILLKENITAYYLVDIYIHLKQKEEKGRNLAEIINDVQIDLQEDNQKTFSGLNEIERLALKIITYLDITPKVLLEQSLPLKLPRIRWVN